MPTNRYTNLSVSSYNPMTMEEIMYAPRLLRQQQNALEENLLKLNSQLATTDPDEKFYGEANRIKTDLNNKIRSQVDELSSKGFNNQTQSSIIKTNREIQDMMSPTGTLGQINAHKVALKKTYDDYIEEAIKAGQSPAIAKIHAEQALQKHRNQVPMYDSNGRVISFNAGNAAPRYVDTTKWIGDLATKVGFDERSRSSAMGALTFDAANNRYVVNSNSKTLTSDNLARLQNLAELATRAVSDPTSEIRQNIDYNFRDPQSVLNDMTTQLGAYRETKDHRENGFSIGSVQWAEDKATDPTGMIISNDSTLTSDAINTKTYEDAVSTIKSLRESESLSPEQKSQLDDLQELQAAAENKMLKDPKYIQALNEYNKAKERLSAKDYPTQGRAAEGEYNIRKAREVQASNNLNNIKDKYWKDSSSMRHNYSYLPSTPKEEGIWNLHNENVYNNLKGIGNLGNVLDLTSIYTTGGTKKNVNDKDVQNVHDLIKNADPKTFKISNIKTYGDNKTPEITATFNTLKGAKEYDIDDEIAWNDEYGGSEQPVTITFKLKRFSNAADTGSAPGYKNLTGAIAQFWKDKGGINQITGNFQGSEVYTSLIKNAYQDIPSKELYERAKVDADAREALMMRVAERQAKKAK